MNSLFLKAKHWQIFLIAIVIPILLQISFGIMMLSQSNSTLPTILFLTFFLFCILSIFGWFWAITYGFQRKLESNLKSSLIWFKVFFFLLLFHIILIFSSLIISYGGENFAENPQSLGVLGTIVSVFSYAKIIYLIGIIYCVYITAKTFKTFQLKRKLEFTEFKSDFFSFIFLPIGIWTIQPKINELIKNDLKVRRHNNG